MSVLTEYVKVEGLSEEKVKNRFNTGKSNVLKVLKVLLYEELKAEMAPPEKEAPKTKSEVKTKSSIQPNQPTKPK